MLSRINFLKFIDNKYLIFLDQSLLSIINFGSILIISKLAAIDVFSSFVVTYSYSYFIYIFSTFFISSPILIFLSKKWKSLEGEYLTISIVLNFIVNIFFSISGYFFLTEQIGWLPFLPFFLLSFSMSFFDILKKFIFSSNGIQIKYGLFGTGIINFIFFTLIFLQSNNLSIESILFVYYISFGSAVIYLLTVISFKGIFKTKLIKNFRANLFFSREIIEVHFHYSKWIILGGIAFWGYSQGVYIIAKAFGVDDFTIGKVRTVQNLLGVFNILLITLESHYLPIFSRVSLEHQFKKIFIMTRRILNENGIKFSILFLFSIPIGLLFYDILYIDKYGSGTIVFLSFLLIQILLILFKPFSIALKSIEKTKPFFSSHLLAAATTVVCLPIFQLFTVSYSIPFSLIIANLMYVFYIFIVYRKEERR